VDAPKTLFGKFSIQDKNLDDIPKSWRALARKEIDFYNTVQNPGVSIPTCYFAGIDDDLNMCILLEDLGQDVWVDQLTSATQAQTTQAIKSLATLHATWWNHSDLDKLEWLNPAPPDESVDALNVWRGSITLFQKSFTETCPHLHQIGQIFLKILEVDPAIASPRAGGKGNKTLRHGDFRLDNLAFAEEQLVVNDWQMVSKGPAIADLVYWLCCNYTPTARREQEPLILDLYIQTLAEHGIEYPLKKLKANIRFQLMGRCLSRIGSLSVVQETLFANERGQQFIQHDMAGLEALVVDYKVLRSVKMLGFALLNYARLKRLIGFSKRKP
ncbi:MAG: phosphotransferase, partial [Pseudomonadota bacterium]